LPLTIGLVGMLSFALVPLFPSTPGRLPRPAWRWLGVGGALFAVQALLFVSGIARFGGATASNVIYSSRGVWSLVGVALVGRWFHSSETHLGASVLRWRLFGATLMFTGIVLVLV
jgi:hypothetical protein